MAADSAAYEDLNKNHNAQCVDAEDASLSTNSASVFQLKPNYNNEKHSNIQRKRGNFSLHCVASDICYVNISLRLPVPMIAYENNVIIEYSYHISQFDWKIILVLITPLHPSINKSNDIYNYFGLCFGTNELSYLAKMKLSSMNWALLW